MLTVPDRHTSYVRRLLSALFLGACLAWSDDIRADGQITITDLGTLGGASSEARAINDAAQVVGTADFVDGSKHAFVWSADVGMTDLDVGFARGINSSGAVVGDGFVWTPVDGMVFLDGANAISDAGYVAGRSQPIPGDPSFHPFVWRSDTGTIDLGTLGGQNCVTHAVNNRGEVTGECNIVPGTPDASTMHAFFASAATGMIDLGTLGGGRSFGDFINDNGEIAGESYLANGDEHAFVWSAATGMVDLGTLGGNHSQSEGLNNNGQITGTSSTTDGHTHAFIRDPQTGCMLDLGALGGGYSVARGLNASGQVVGYSGATFPDQHAFFWSAGTGMLDLGTLGGRFSYALAVNNNGGVVGRSETASGAFHAVMWTIGNTPVGTDVAVQPIDTTTGTNPVTTRFSAVTQRGSTTLTTSSTGPAPPAGFTVGTPATYYDISTTATFSGVVTVCINYTGTTFTSTPALFHFEGVSWVDRTSSLDTVNRIICASVNSLSPFAIFQRKGALLTTLAVAPTAGTYGGRVTLTATLLASGQPVPGQEVAFVLGSVAVGVGVTDANGRANVADVSLSAFSAGTYPGVIHASFNGNSAYLSSMADGDLTVVDWQGPVTSNLAITPNPVLLNTPFTISAKVDDSTTGGSAIKSAEYTLNGGSTWSAAVPTATPSLGSSAIVNVTWSIPGQNTAVYTACVRGTDVAGQIGPPTCTTLAVYDPGAGCMSGAGSIASPSGAFAASPSLTGKADFPTVAAKYAKGATVPTGSAQFTFSAAKMTMVSANYKWLIAQTTTPNRKAWLRGSGTNSVNGTSYPVEFLVSVVDSVNGDMFRVKIWKQDGTLVYDNQRNAPDGADATQPVMTGPASVIISSTCR